MLRMKLSAKPLTKFWPENCVQSITIRLLYEFIFKQLAEKPNKQPQCQNCVVVKLWGRKWYKWYFKSFDHNIFPKPIGREKLPILWIRFRTRPNSPIRSVFLVRLRVYDTAYVNACKYLFWEMPIMWHWLIDHVESTWRPKSIQSYRNLRPNTNNTVIIGRMDCIKRRKK